MMFPFSCLQQQHYFRYLGVAGLLLIALPPAQPVRDPVQNVQKAQLRRPFCSGDQSLDLKQESRRCRKRCTYDLVAHDVCRVSGERTLTAATSHLDFANATAFVNGNVRRRKPLRFMKRGKFHAPCRGAESPHEGVDRTMLVTLVPAYHGSTALLEFLMSNPGVSTLCPGDMWECEGSKLGTLPKLMRSNSNNPCAGKRHQQKAHLKFLNKMTFDLQCHLADWTSLDNEGQIRNSSFANMLNVVHETRAIRNPKRWIGSGVNAVPAATITATDGGLTGARATSAYLAKVQHALQKPFGDDYRIPGAVPLTAAIWDAVATWSHIWDLEKPVLLEKTPSWYDDVELLHDALLSYPGWWPLKTVRPVYTVMWKPLCLTSLSTHFRRDFWKDERHSRNRNLPNSTMPTTTAKYLALQREVDRVERAANIVDWAKRVGARLAVINYADLLWNADVVSARLQALLPCIASRGFDSTWTPSKKVDTFLLNQFKVVGSTDSYGRKHSAKSMFYNLESGKCQPDFLSASQLIGASVLKSPAYTDLLARYESYTLRLIEVEINF